VPAPRLRLFHDLVPMITHLCDRCGRAIEHDQVRYVAQIQVFAAPDPLTITFEDLLQDHTSEMERLLRQCDELSEEELMRDVHVEFQFDLCRACQKVYVTNPLATASRAGLC
jgi:hypothetical protein